MTEQSEHLSNAQVENYGKRTSDAGAESGQSDEPQRVDDLRFDDQRVEAHLADCPSCRKRLLDFHRSHFAMLAGPADPQLRTASTPECPSDDDLRQLAAGLSSDAVATKLTQHAATCDHCGPLLRTFTEDFSDDFTPEEQAALANLQSGSERWQRDLAKKMANSHESDSKKDR